MIREIDSRFDYRAQQTASFLVILGLRVGRYLMQILSHGDQHENNLHHVNNIAENYCYWPYVLTIVQSWWRHQMEIFSALLAFCVGNSPVTGEFSAQRPVTWSLDVFLDLRLNKRLSKQSWGWWLETPWDPLWRHYCFGRTNRGCIGTSNAVHYQTCINALLPSDAILWHTSGSTLIQITSGMQHIILISMKSYC